MIYVFIATKTTADVALPVPAFNQSEYNRRVSNAFKASTGGHLMVGDLKLRPDGNAVQNHLLCDGSEVSRVQFPELFGLLRDTQGAGDGSTTFNLPNYMGTALAVPETGPVQNITEHGTVENPIPVTEPTEPGQVGGTDGGNIVSGGRELRDRD